jgi:hypothetical protein
MKTAYVVGDSAWRDITLKYVCLSEKSAIGKWHEQRKELIKYHENCIKVATDSGCYNDTSERCLKYLIQTDDPKKVSEYNPFHIPFIVELEVCE